MTFRIPLVLNNGEFEQIQPGDILDVRAASYTFEQLLPAATWTIRHGLDRYPTVTIFDSSGQLCYGEVRYLDSNIVQVRFNSPFSGHGVIQ